MENIEYLLTKLFDRDLIPVKVYDLDGKQLYSSGQLSAADILSMMHANGVDDTVFGVANSAMAPILEAPFYGIKTRAVSSFSLAGLAVDEDCRILREDGTATPNLFGAGELICGNITGGERYTGSGSQVGSGLHEGKIIAAAITAE